MRNFDLGNHEETRLLHHRVRALNLVFSRLRCQLGKSRNIQIKTTVAVSGPHTFRGSYNTGTIVSVVSVITTFVVTTFVSAKGLSGGEGLVTDRAFVGPTATAGGGSDDTGGSDGGRGGLVVGSDKKFPVACLVSPKSLVRGEGFVANRAFVGELGGRIWGRLLWRWRGGGGSGGAASEHDEADSEILFFRRVVAGTLGTLAFCPWDCWVVKRERGSSCCGRVESLESHMGVWRRRKVENFEDVMELGVRVGVYKEAREVA